MKWFLLPVCISVGIALSGCAWIVKGPNSSVRLDLPPQTEVRNYSGHDVSVEAQGSERTLHVPSGEDYLVEYQVGAHRDSMLLESRLKLLYIFCDIWMVFPVGLIIDLDGSAYEIDKDFIAFPPPPDSLGIDSTTTQYLNIYPYYGAPDASTPLGIVAMAHAGAKYPYSRVPLLGNNFGLGLGYRLFDKLVLMGYYGDNSLMDYAPDDTPLHMEAGITTFAVEGRYYITRNFYATGGLEYLFIGADSLQLTQSDPPQTVRGFADQMPGISLGAGLAFQGIFCELRQHWGLKPLYIREFAQPPVSNFAIRFGLNLEF